MLAFIDNKSVPVNLTLPVIMAGSGSKELRISVSFDMFTG